MKTLLIQDQDEYTKAEPLYQRALQVFGKTFPGGHPNIAVVEKNYAAMKVAQAEAAE